MKILQVNKFYYPKGGADKYFLDLSRALEKAGHQVAVFAMQDKKNLTNPFTPYFVSNFDFDNLSFKQVLKTPGRIIYSQEAKRKFHKLVLDFQPDIIHIHNIYHQISPSILDIAKKYKIPVVMHLHDYKLICPNYQLFAHGKICEACRPNKFYRCVQKKCFKNSFGKSLLVTIEMYIHHKFLKIYKKNITTFIAPSNFMKQKIREFGWETEKITVIVNPYSDDISSPLSPLDSKETEDDYLLYFGRLSEEKDVATLIKVAQENNWSLKIAGSGPTELMLKEIAEVNNPQKGNKPLIEFLGFKKGVDLQNIILRAKAVIIPSISYDNMPLSLLEALHLKKIVIASRIGGIPEIIKDGVNGLLFTPGQAEELKDKIKSIDSLDRIALKIAAQNSVDMFSPANNLNAVVGIYNDLIKDNAK